MEEAAAAGFYLPEALAFEILQRLPVKSVLRFKFVCKSWHDLISSRIFISNHYHIHKCLYLLVDRWDIARRGPTISLLNQSLKNPTALSTIDLDLSPIPSNFEFYGFPRVFGPCNGILCLFDHIPDNIVLWNPVIRELKTLPHSQICRPPMNDEDPYFGEVGFGFDPQTNDYKILQTLIFPSAVPQFELFSLRANSWKKLEAPNVPTSFEWQGALSLAFTNNRIICWLAVDESRSEWEVVSFDMSKETFNIIQLPLEIGELKEERRGILFPFKNSIALIFYPSYQATDDSIDVWMMNDFFVPEPKSWKKLLSLHLNEVTWPLGFWNDDQILFQHRTGELVLYDPRTQDTSFLGVHGDAGTLKTLVYKESLFSIK